MGQIKFIHPGLLTTVQDGGRYGSQQYGVPLSGAIDSFAHRVSNILVGNDDFEAALEITMMGPKIQALDDTVIAITGGDLSPTLNGQTMPMWQSIYIHKGDVIEFSGLKSGCRSYISFAGGIDVPVVMGSKSTYVKANLGGYEGRAFIIGDSIKLSNKENKLVELSNRRIPSEYIPIYEKEIEVRVILGPQEDYFTENGIRTFLTSEYTVTNECDRMGYRLEGPLIEHKQGADIISDGIAFGAIQIPGHGRPIIMMADRQTTGGYTKIANVISIDLPKIAQAKPGDKVVFRKIDTIDAQRLLVEYENSLRYLRTACSLRKIINTRNWNIKVNGVWYQVKTEEIEHVAKGTLK